MTPATESAHVLASFDRIRCSTECTYARSAKLVGVADDGGGPARLLAALRAVDQDDGVVYSIDNRKAGATIGTLRTTTGGLLRALTESDGGRSLDPNFVLDPSWWFRIGQVSFFVSAFSPCYPTQSSRFAFEAQETYVLFLSVASFVRRRPPGALELPPAVKGAIRTAYSSAGRPYDLELTLSAFEAYRIVKPVTFGAPPVRWWED